MLKAILLSLALSLVPPAVHSVGTITLTGTASPLIYFSGGPNVSGSSASLSPEINGAPIASAVFTNLPQDGNPIETCSFGMRLRGNSPCHVGVSVASYTPTNMSFQGVPLTGLSSELAFVKLGQGPISSGANGNSTGITFGPKFTTGSTLASLNGGLIGPVTSSSDTVFSCPKPPSLSGTISSPDNWVEAQETFSIPTGLGWGSTDGANPGSFGIIIQESAFPGA